jgi:hypothetical protein
VVPKYLSNLPTVKHHHDVMSNIKSGITSHCVGARKSEIVVAKDIVCTFATWESLGSSRAVTRVFGIDRRNIKKGLERRLQLVAD